MIKAIGSRMSQVIVLGAYWHPKFWVSLCVHRIHVHTSIFVHINQLCDGWNKACAPIKISTLCTKDQKDTTCMSNQEEYLWEYSE
jgi:hypothetical protein